jgi:hypothetical protein
MQYTVMHTAAVRYVVLQIKDGHHPTTHKGTNMNITQRQLSDIEFALTLAEYFVEEQEPSSECHAIELAVKRAQRAIAEVNNQNGG